MRYKIISDSSSDLFELNNIAYASVPLKIITDEKEYVDTAALDVEEMVSDLKKYSGVSRSSCPNTQDWKDSFEDYDGVFCVTITSGLSGSCNSANMALNDHLSKNPEKKGFVIDTLTAGPEIALIIEKLRDLITSGIDFEEIKAKINEYKAKTHLIFSLESLRNLANNGRCSMALAKFAGLLGIRAIGKASLQGTLELTDKVRGAKNSLSTVFKNMLSNGYIGGRVRIHHCQNDDAAKTLADMIKEKFPKASVIIEKTGALCSFYAEAGGLLIGYEGAQKPVLA